MMKHIFILLMILSSLIILTSCAKYNYTDATILIGNDKINVQIANNDEERTTGLMNRKNLRDNEGMFFVFPDEEPRTFWMKNTLIPLDIIFIDSRYKIVMIQEAEPCKTDNCAVYYSKYPAQYVLEVNKGHCTENNINIGDEILVKNY